MSSPKKIFITGIAGFIGYHVAKALIKRGDFVIGCDNFNAYYSTSLKRKRASLLKKLGIEILNWDLIDLKNHHQEIKELHISHLVHLAAQAGVRYSLTHPRSYIESNIQGFLEVLELCRYNANIKLVYASSSSVYGLNTKIPFSEEDRVSSPANLYAASKQSNELMAYAYHQLYKCPITALRFFTVYGPWGRPDMAYFSFTQAIDKGDPIQLFNQGEMRRDFTYIDDIVDGLLASIDLGASYETFNLGNHKPESLFSLVHAIESSLGKKANIEYLPMQPGEVLETFADTAKSKRLLGFEPKISLKQGIDSFVHWYQEEGKALISSK